MSRLIPPSQTERTEDEDRTFCNYLVSLMKNLPKRKKLMLQSKFIVEVTENLEDWMKHIKTHKDLK